ncbi:Fe2+-dependent dioxygenase [Pseudomonas neustonica]|uniref:Fe2+-dependent dioxygenase n=1 Tax=Pseudomonas neustonica TaxID=2487346 RepID=A0ABX9XL81_9PSED|nr:MULTISPECIES: Fe2+-dependent dioxygenase [Pseudomonas]ROZ85566.1 Fe2+-dependent dioxygenase [Pseudomonas sp. SSM44]ROZ87540.1 Fe2+-dependent dioxygenase [Pseudomonas neustonica]|tara:strand:+ start:4428 stop:5111 length:684 start_codon:yes stop_codon:yes gene_type:complete
MIIVIPAVFSASEVSKIRSHLDAAEWQDGSTTAGSQAQQVKHNQQLALDNKIAQQLGDVIINTLSQQPTFVSAALPLRIFPPMFNRYRTGNTYGLHVDNAIRYVPGNPTPIRTDLSATLFLCDPQEYEGGELVIEDNFGSQRIKLNAGDLVLYPSTSLHTVTPVSDGARTCAVFWLQSMVRSNQQRETLFELDQSVQSLTAELGAGHDDVVRLSGVYHNLIRQWADT